MDAITSCVESIRAAFTKYRRKGLTETQTRTIFINPMLEALGWDVRDPDHVQEEFPTLGGKAVDYALKTDLRPAAFVEAKSLDDPLGEKDTVQLISYGASAGVEWCILTNGIRYKVYRSTIGKPAHEKLVYEVDLDPDSPNAASVEVATSEMSPLCRESFEKGVLAEAVASECVKKALDELFADPPGSLINLVHSRVEDLKVTKGDVKKALPDLRRTSLIPVKGSPLGPEIGPKRERGAEEESLKQQRVPEPSGPGAGVSPSRSRERIAYTEEHHTEGVPAHVAQLYHELDTFCTGLDPGNVIKKPTKPYVGWWHRGRIFCDAVLLKRAGLRVSLNLKYEDLVSPPKSVRDVSKIGHWGNGDVELRVSDVLTMELAKSYIQRAFQQNR